MEYLALSDGLEPSHDTYHGAKRRSYPPKTPKPFHEENSVEIDLDSHQYRQGGNRASKHNSDNEEDHGLHSHSHSLSHSHPHPHSHSHPHSQSYHHHPDSHSYSQTAIHSQRHYDDISDDTDDDDIRFIGPQSESSDADPSSLSDIDRNGSDDHPTSNPPSRRASFLDRYNHFPVESLNREMILNRGRKVSQGLDQYSKGPRKSKKTHQRVLSREQLGYRPVTEAPLLAQQLSSSSSVHSRTSSRSSRSQREYRLRPRHRKGASSNVEEAAKKLMREVQGIQAREAEMYENGRRRTTRTFGNRRGSKMAGSNDTPSPPAMGHNPSMITEVVSDEDKDGDDVLSDDHFLEKFNKFNAAHGGAPSIPPPVQIGNKRFSRSQPTSPRRYDFGFNLKGDDHDDIDENGQSSRQSALDEMPPEHATLQATRSNFQIQMKRPSASSRQSNDRNNDMNRQRPLKPESIWRKNRMAFLEQMDKKLEEAIAKFANKYDNGMTAGPMTPSSTTSSGVPSGAPPTFRGNPLQRKRGRSYHVNQGGVVGKPNHSSSQSMAFDPSAFSFNESLINASPSPMAADSNGTGTGSMTERALEDDLNTDIASIIKKPSSLTVRNRRSISLPSSPTEKQILYRNDNLNSPRKDSVEMEDDDGEDEEEDEEDEKTERDVLSNDDHDERDRMRVHEDNDIDSSSGDEEEEENHEEEEEEAALPISPDRPRFMGRQESDVSLSRSYNRSIRRRRLVRALKSPLGGRPVVATYPTTSSSFDSDDDDDDEEQMEHQNHTIYLDDHQQRHLEVQDFGDEDQQQLNGDLATENKSGSPSIDDEEDDEEDDHSPNYRSRRLRMNRLKRRYRTRDSKDSDSGDEVEEVDEV